MFDIEFTRISLKQLEKIVKGNKAVSNVMKKKFADLQSIDLKEAIKLKQIKLVKGMPEKILESLSKENYDPAVYEYPIFRKVILTGCISCEKIKR